MSALTTHSPADVAEPAAGGDRDRFLDLLRAAATIRVVLWHAYGAPWLTWILASMPAMFFVSGALLARSAKRRPLHIVLVERFRRIAMPLWTFALVAWIAMGIAAAHTGSSIPFRRAVWWFVPLLDPVGTSWEGGWLATPLWYLRALIWVLLASPLLLLAARRIPLMTACGGVGAVVVCEVLVRRGTWTPDAAPRLWWYLADFALYGTFFIAGAATERQRRAHRRINPRWAIVPAAAAMVWLIVVGSPTGVVNDSHVLHLLVGAGWLLVALGCRGRLRDLADRPPVRRLLRLFTQHSLTIYLWHTSAIVLAVAIRNLLPDVTPSLGRTAFPVVIAVLTALAIWLFGTVERRASQARTTGTPSRPHRSLAMAGIITSFLLVASHSATADASVHRTRVPSQAPPVPREIDLIVANDLPVTPRQLPAVLDRRFQEWIVANDVEGGAIGVLAPAGWRWTSTAGEWPQDGRSVGLDDEFETMSVTKMFTASLVAQAVSTGLTSLNAPIGDLGVDGISPSERFTLRQLLEHTTGLANWRSTPEAAAAVAEERVLQPEDAVRAALRMPRADGVPSYSSTNSILAAMTLEHLLGRPFEDIANEELDRLGLDHSRVVPPSRSGVNHGSAGLVTTVDDLLDLTRSILVDPDRIDDDLNTTMRNPDRTTGVGLGTAGLCPCDADRPGYFGLVGHYGGYAMAAIDPATDYIVVLNITDSFWLEPGFLETTDTFLVGLLRLAAESLDP